MIFFRKPVPTFRDHALLSPRALHRFERGFELVELRAETRPIAGLEAFAAADIDPMIRELPIDAEPGRRQEMWDSSQGPRGACHGGCFAWTRPPRVATMSAQAGRCRATGPHVHYEVRIDDDPIDPTRFLTAGDKLLPLL